MGRRISRRIRRCKALIRGFSSFRYFNSTRTQFKAKIRLRAVATFLVGKFIRFYFVIYECNLKKKNELFSRAHYRRCNKSFTGLPIPAAVFHKARRFMDLSRRRPPRVQPKQILKFSARFRKPWPLNDGAPTRPNKICEKKRNFFLEKNKLIFIF